MGNGKTAGSSKSTKKPISKRRAPAMKKNKARRRVQTLARSKNASETVSTAVNAETPITTTREHVGKSSSPSLLFWPTLPFVMMQIWFGPKVERRL
jgi:hypothetical protein